MTLNQKKLLDILREMFQFDQSDLDFGIYRIMLMKGDEINRFLNEELPIQITDGLQTLAELDTAADVAEIERQIADTKASAISNNIKVTAIADLEEKKKAALAGGVDIVAVEADIYNHLTNFFSRYYDDGDFISQRRYKDGVYAIPYEGEEVKLHWANADQYYVKTSEYFKDYTFKTKYGDIVHFKLVEAEAEHDNNKANEKRFFQIYTDNPFEVKNGELFIYVEYKNGGKTKQDTCIAEIVEAFIGVQNRKEFQPFNAILEIIDGKTLLQRQLVRYTARNTFDYFIHKDLGKFLNRELDFYIKSDVIFLDDIDVQNEAKTKEYMTKAKVIRKIARKIITFLAQIENFQKKLYLKKKFVVETNYCITLDRVPVELYPEIAANEAQREEWVRLFAIDEITGGDLITVPYSIPLTVEFLKANQFLMLDTAFYDAIFKDRLIENIDKLDESLDGLLIHSENFQALDLLQEKYFCRIDSIHIDPPYNTDTSGFLYKNNYRHSSWASMMFDRIGLAYKLLDYDNGSFKCHIDENEYELLFKIFNKFPWPSVGTIVWDKLNPMLGGKGVATQHEYVIYRSNYNRMIYARDDNISKIKEYAQQAINENGGINNVSRQAFKRMIMGDEMFSGGDRAYHLIDDEGLVYRLVAMGAPERRTDPKYFVPLIHPETNKPCPIPSNGWSRTPETMRNMLRDGNIIFGKDETTQPQKKVILNRDSIKQIASVIADGNSGKADLDRLDLVFPYAHPVSLYEKLISANNPQIVLDFFAGSGTTGHAIINLNREDEGKRKYILVEMGEYFDTVTKPRIEKVVYSMDTNIQKGWKDGKPVSRIGSSHAFKYIRLESYEDTLNNIILRDSFNDLPESVREGYFLSYMLNTEAKASDCLLNVDKLDKPFDYRMNITRNLESKECTIDLVESFNYFLGLEVVKNRAMIAFGADFTTGEYGAVSATLKTGERYKFKAIEGILPGGEKALVIWREMTGDVVKDNAVLDAYFLSLPDSRSFKWIYTNRDNNLMNLRQNDEDWQVILIDEEMKKRMFESIK